jgi:hypothetical protein
MATGGSGLLPRISGFWGTDRPSFFQENARQPYAGLEPVMPGAPGKSLLK